MFLHSLSIIVRNVIPVVRNEKDKATACVTFCFAKLRINLDVTKRKQKETKCLMNRLRHFV